MNNIDICLWVGNEVGILEGDELPKGDRPLWCSEIPRAVKSCTAPMKIEPKTAQSRAGSQPQIMAMAG